MSRFITIEIRDRGKKRWRVTPARKEGNMIITIETKFDLPITKPISITPIVEWNPDAPGDQQGNYFFVEILWPILESQLRVLAGSIFKVMDETRKVAERIKDEREGKSDGGN